MFSFKSLFAIIATTITLVHSSPAVYPEVIPGPGLPSLESLNLTSRDLYTMKTPAFDSSLKPRSTDFDATCYKFTTGDVDNTIACFNYLVSIGNNACVVPTDISVFCTAGDAGIGGTNLHPTSGAVSSACRDVATAVQWVFTYCNVGGRVGGIDAAYGNGNLIVGVYNSAYILGAGN